MDPFSIIALLAITNIILEKGILPHRRLTREQVGQVDCGALGKLGLKQVELEELQNHPVVLLGKETERQAAANAARNGEQHV